MASIKIYSKEQVDAKVPDTTGASVGDVLTVGSSGNQWTTPSSVTVVQQTGTSTTSVMSQDAVTTALGNKADTSSLPTSSQLVPSTSGASSGDVLKFDGTNIGWSAGGSGGGMTPHTYSNFLELKQALNANCDYSGSSANQKPIKGLLYYFPATSYAAFPTQIRHSYIPCLLSMGYLSAYSNYPTIRIYAMMEQSSSGFNLVAASKTLNSVDATTTTITPTLYKCSLTTGGVSLSNESITMSISEFIYYY